MCSGALRKYLADRDELPDTSLVATVPVSVHGRSEAPGANKVSALFSSLASDIADPVERLRAIGEQNTAAKDHHQTLSASLLQDWAQFAAPNTFALAVRMYSALRLANRHPVIHNLVISNVPGPPMPIYFMGAKITAFYPFGPVFDGAGLNITVMSNAGTLNIGAIACRELAPHLWELADDMPIALDELLRAGLDASSTARSRRHGDRGSSTGSTRRASSQHRRPELVELHARTTRARPSISYTVACGMRRARSRCRAGGISRSRAGITTAVGHVDPADPGARVEAGDDRGRRGDLAAAGGPELAPGPGVVDDRVERRRPRAGAAGPPSRRCAG